MVGHAPPTAQQLRLVHAQPHAHQRGRISRRGAGPPQVRKGLPKLWAYVAAIVWGPRSLAATDRSAREGCESRTELTPRRAAGTVPGQSGRTAIVRVLWNSRICGR